MNRTLPALCLAVASTVVLSASTLALTPHADAAGRTYGTVLTVSTAKLKACKVEIQQGTKFRVYGFLDNSQSKPKDEVYGRITVLNDGKKTSQSFNTGYIAGGKRSDVDSVVIPKKKGFTLEVVAAGRNVGNGAEISYNKVRDC